MCVLLATVTLIVAVTSISKFGNISQNYRYGSGAPRMAKTDVFGGALWPRGSIQILESRV